MQTHLRCLKWYTGLNAQMEAPLIPHILVRHGTSLEQDLINKYRENGAVIEHLASHHHITNVTLEELASNVTACCSKITGR